MKKSFLFLLCIVLGCALFFSGCAEKDYGEKPQVKLELEDGKIIMMELYPDVAPMSVKHFIENVESGYYNGKVFHRAVKNFMIQGGSADGKGVGGSGRTVKGEFSSNGIENNLKHTRGVVSLARSNNPDSASGQFFIMHADSPHLDGNYAAFGKVTEGMEVVDEIANMEVRGVNNDSLVKKPVIISMTMVENK